MKPGRPMAVGKKGHQFIFCLPGNPVAAFVCFRLLVRPVLDSCQGRMRAALQPDAVQRL